MKWAEIKTVVGKWVVIRQFAGSYPTSQFGVFKITNYKDFPPTFKVVLSPAKPFKEKFGESDIYSMDLAGMLNEQNVFDNYQKAVKYYNTVKE